MPFLKIPFYRYGNHLEYINLKVFMGYLGAKQSITGKNFFFLLAANLSILLLFMDSGV